MKTSNIIPAGVALSILFSAGLTAAADAKAGKALHDSRCLKCHGTEVYTAKDRKTSSLEALKATVGRCSSAAQANWTDAQKADVVVYLNDAFYRFK